MNLARKLNPLLLKGAPNKMRTICGRRLSAVRFDNNENDNGTASTGTGRVVMRNCGAASTFKVVYID
jgi:hypothetical protein